MYICENAAGLRGDQSEFRLAFTDREIYIKRFPATASNLIGSTHFLDERLWNVGI